MRNYGKLIVLFTIIFIIGNGFFSYGEDLNNLNEGNNKVYRFAGDYNHPPYEYVDKNGRFTGFNVDIINAIAEIMNIDVQIIPMSWDNAVWSLDTGEVDGIIGMAQNDSRLERYRFTSHTLLNEQVIFVHKDTVHVSSIEELAGFRVAYQRGDYNEAVLLRISNVKRFPKIDQEEALMALANGEVDAVLGNKLVGIYHLQRNKLTDEIKIVGEPISSVKYGPVVSMDNEELLNILEEGLHLIIENKTYEAIYNKWFGESISNLRLILDLYKDKLIFGLIILLMSFVFLYMYSKRLQKEVSKRTLELEMANKNLIEQQKEIYNLAYFDPITSLPNRTYFVEEVNNKFENPDEVLSNFAILFLDIDRFKHINDTLGHNVGDYILKLLGNRLSKLVKSGDIVARAGGDEFYILMNNYKNIDEVTDLAERILADFKSPYIVKDYTLYLTTSIGIVTFPDGGVDTHSLIKNADLALYKSKGLGGNTYYIYGEEIKSEGLERMMLLNQLRYAVEYDELVLHYQPQIDISTGEIRGVEALVRWNHPERGLLYPDEFIYLAEESGFIIQMGEWIIRQACLDGKKWQDEGKEIIVSVNISSKQFQQDDFVNKVTEIINESGLNPRNLTLEITETIAISDIKHTIEVLNRLRSLGIAVAIDDFGTGYSSLSYLNEMSVNELKIDRSFIWDIERNDKNKLIS
ncbi:MAG: EAL domain-containing protein, partial [Tissierellia bacterium]|nr:EAL domain-containing protein [Tissierellia bacterium]